MQIVKKENANSVNVELEGRLETGTAPTFEVEMEKIISSKKEVVLDFSKLEYISSAGLRVLLSAQRAINARNGKMRIINVNDVVKEVFDITGFTSILSIE